MNRLSLDAVYRAMCIGYLGGDGDVPDYGKQHE